MEATSTYYAKPKRKYLPKARLWGGVALLYLGISYAGAAVTAHAIANNKESPLEKILITTAGIAGTIGCTLKMRERLEEDSD